MGQEQGDRSRGAGAGAGQNILLLVFQYALRLQAGDLCERRNMIPLSLARSLGVGGAGGAGHSQEVRRR